MRFLILIMIFTFASCASKNSVSAVREPAEDTARSCPIIMKEFLLKPDYNDDIKLALKEKKLITFKAKLMQIHFPRLEWINRLKKSLNVTLRNLNNKAHPTFYLSNDELIVPIAEKYAQAFEKELSNQLDDEATNNLKTVRSWVSAYENYAKELDQLLEERVSLQYNLTLLKKMDLKNEERDIQLSYKRSGVLTSEIISLHPEDKTYKSLLSNLKNQISDLDGGLIKNGKIKERIIRQAMLQDMLTMVHRKLEYRVKNAQTIPSDVVRELARLTSIIKNPDLNPSTFGVFKITDRIFIRELASLTKLDVVYDTFKEPLTKLKSIFSNFFSKDSTDEEKVGFFANIYAKITSLTPEQVAIGGGVAAIAGVGTYRYFWFDSKDSSVKEMPNDPHEVQLEKTEEVELDKSASMSKAIEVEIETQLLQ